MYKLIVKDGNGNWNPLDLGDEAPAMVYQVNDIAELKNRNADGSQAIRLPKTDSNIRAFGFASVSDAVSSAPYKRHECRLFSNDYVLAGKGSYLVFDRIGQYFEVQILSGNANFFDYLKDNKLETLDLGYAELSLEGISEESGRYIFPAATFRIDSINAAGSLKDIDKERIFPSVYLKYIIEEMVTTHGFSLVHNISYEDLNNKLISLATLKPDESSLDVFKGYNESSSIIQSGPAYLPWADDQIHNASGLLRPFVEGAMSAIEYKSPINGVLNIRVEFQNLGGFTGAILRVGGDGPHYAWDRDGGGIVDQTLSIEVQKGDLIRLWLVSKATNPGANAIYKFSVESLETDVVPFGGKVPLSKNLGFDSQLDLFKAFAQLFGLVISVDNIEKIVYAYTFEKLYDNKSIARDWSDKLHVEDNIETVFDLTTYAQVNTISFNADGNYLDAGKFTINNETLAPLKELFKIEFQSGRDYYQTSNDGVGFMTANIPLLEKDTDTDSFTFKDGKPHILNRSESKKTFTVNSNDPVKETVDLYPITHAKAQSFIDTHYDRLVNNMLNNAKKIEPFLNLNEYDIEMFDQMIPIYLSYYGAYFYVNKINNFVSDRLTRCELIRL